MNNIEVNQLKKDIKKYLKYSTKDIEKLGALSDKKLSSMKKDIERIKSRVKKESTSNDNYQKNLAKRRLNDIIKASNILRSKPQKPPRPNYINQGEIKRIEVSKDRKPKILFISDVKGWAWWIKSEYLKKHLSDEFEIAITCVLGDGCVPQNRLDQNTHDFYFTFGHSYIDFLYRVPKKKKATGITAHRATNMIFPKMRMAGHVHANSMMLLKELHSMGFKRAYYVPNGVNEELFKPITPIKKEGQLIVGHVGKECPAKGQREFILPAIQTTKSKSATNLRTWKDRLPHSEMPKIYNEMDVFVVASTEDGTPNPALEAAACGRPIISNPIGNMPELIQDGYNGFLVPRKIGAYVEKIKYFQENRDELIRMGNNARKTIEEGWTWKIQSENYRKMFRDIFKRTG